MSERRTPAEIAALQEEYLADPAPAVPIEHTPGFETYRSMLREWRLCYEQSVQRKVDVRLMARGISPDAYHRGEEAMERSTNALRGAQDALRGAFGVTPDDPEGAELDAVCEAIVRAATARIEAALQMSTSA